MLIDYFIVQKLYIQNSLSLNFENILTQPTDYVNSQSFKTDEVHNEFIITFIDLQCKLY